MCVRVCMVACACVWVGVCVSCVLLAPVFVCARVVAFVCECVFEYACLCVVFSRLYMFVSMCVSSRVY